MTKAKLKSRLFKMIRRFALKLWSPLFEGDPLSNPLAGDRCIEYAFVIKNLLNLDRSKYKAVLDIGCSGSPLTTVIKELGFSIDGLDLLPSPLIYENVAYIRGDILSTENLRSSYDIVVLCSTIEHIGLGRRYSSKDVERGDIKTLERVKDILAPNGLLILTIPYGEQRAIRRLHRVYNKNGELLKYASDNFEVEVEEFYKNNLDNIWVKCEEYEARRVVPSEDNYALGLFVFRRKGGVKIVR